MDYSDHKAVIKLLEELQEDEKDVRDRCREQSRFLKMRDGQWEEAVIQKMGKRPRFTFDHTSRVINDIAGEIEQSEFGGRAIAKSEKAKGDISETYDGMLRSIQNMSSAELIYKKAGRHLVERGFDAWLIVTDWADVDAFEQDIMVKPIRDSLNRVWVDHCWHEADRSDSGYGFVTTCIEEEEYREEFPKGLAQSLPNGIDATAQADDDDIITAAFYYIKTTDRIIHLLNDGRVVADEDYQPVAADYEARGIAIQKTRKRKLPTCYMRKLDGGGWLTDEKATPFAYVPIVCVYANLDFIDNEIIYFGETERLMDPQRVYNYARSREIEEGALSPRKKIMMTPAQADGHSAQISTLNTNADPVQFYNPESSAPPPYEIGGAQPNASLALTAQASADDIQNISGNFAPSQGKPISGHSGVAYELLQNKSDTGNNHYQEALKIGIAYTAKIIGDAIPKVYDTRSRQVRLVGEDGAIDFKSVNDDDGTNIVRDLSQGHYDYDAVAGPSFRNRKTEGLNAMLELMRIDPTILEDGKDVLIKSMDAPYINQLSDRIRAQMIKEGRIPEKQLTDDEREKIMQEMQNRQPDPMDQLTQAAVHAQTQQIISAIQTSQQKAADDHETAMAKIENTIASTLKLLQEASAAGALQSPALQPAYQQTAQELSRGPQNN